MDLISRYIERDRSVRSFERRRGVGLSLLASLLLLCSSGVQAREYGEDLNLDFARPGIYLGIGVVGAKYTLAEGALRDALDDAGLAPLGIDFDVDEAVGVEIVLGYRVNHHFALEVEFEYLAPADLSASVVGNLADLQTISFTANGKAYPLIGRFQPYALVGIGIMESKLEVPGTDATENGFAARFGAGLDVYLTRVWAIDFGVDYLLPGSGEVEDLDYLSFGAGLKVRF